MLSITSVSCILDNLINKKTDEALIKYMFLCMSFENLCFMSIRIDTYFRFVFFVLHVPHTNISV